MPRTDMRQLINQMPEELWVVYDNDKDNTDFSATTEPDNWGNAMIRYVRAA